MTGLNPRQNKNTSRFAIFCSTFTHLDTDRSLKANRSQLVLKPIRIFSFNLANIFYVGFFHLEVFKRTVYKKEKPSGKIGTYHTEHDTMHNIWLLVNIFILQFVLEKMSIYFKFTNFLLLTVNNLFTSLFSRNHYINHLPTTRYRILSSCCLDLLCLLKHARN